MIVPTQQGVPQFMAEHSHHPYAQRKMGVVLLGVTPL